jgi:hypothetical protein
MADLRSQGGAQLIQVLRLKNYGFHKSQQQAAEGIFSHGREAKPPLGSVCGYSWV